MSWFRHIYPPEGYVLLDGGLNNKFEKSIIEDNESPDCLNVIFTNGAVGTREGSTKLNTTAAGTFVCDGLYVRHDNTGSETMCAWFGGTIRALAGTTFTTIASGQSIFTSSTRVAAAEQENHIFFGNGGTIPYKWNGTDFTRHGVYAPTTTSTVASQATGLLTGDYRYKITALNTASVESDVGPVTATFAAASATLRITSIPTFSPSFGVDSRRIYRTATSGAVFKKVADLANNTATSYDDNIADSALGATAPTDNGVPPKYDAIVYHQGRLFMNDLSNPNYIWYSELNQPYTVASTNFLRIGDKSGELVRGIGVFDNSIAVFCDNSVWIIYMQDTTPSNWVIVKAKSSFGSKSPHALPTYENKILFPAIQNTKFAGFADLSGDTVLPNKTTLDVLTAGSELATDRIETDMFLVQEGYLAKISSIVFKNKIYIALTYGAANTTNNRIYVMDFSISNLSKNQMASWVPWTGLNAAQFTVYDGKLYYGTSTTTGFVYRLEAGTYNDDSAAINSYYWTKEFGGIPEETGFFKDFRHVNMLVDLAGAYFMNAHYRTDSDSGDGTQNQINLDPKGSKWGTMVWGVDTWGGGANQKEVRFNLGKSRGKRIQLKFSNQNTANQRFKVHHLSLIYNLKGFR